MRRGSRQNAPKALRVEQAGATVGAGRKIVEMMKSVIMALTRHPEILHPAVAHMPENGVYAAPAVPQEKAADLEYKSDALPRYILPTSIVDTGALGGVYNA